MDSFSPRALLVNWYRSALLSVVLFDTCALMAALGRAVCKMEKEQHENEGKQSGCSQAEGANSRLLQLAHRRQFHSLQKSPVNV